MKFWSSEYIFNHPWDQVTQAAWRKYPNPMNPTVSNIDVLERKVDKGILHTHRLIGSSWKLPNWVQAVSKFCPRNQLLEIIGQPNTMYANERSEVDPSKKKMTLRTRNITFCKYIAVDETLLYEPHPTDKEKTILKQEALILVQGIPLGNYMESLLTNTISTNANKGRQGLEWVLNKINEEIKELSSSALKNTDELLNHTKKSIDDITKTAKKSMDELSNVAKKSLDDLQFSKNSQIPKDL